MHACFRYLGVIFIITIFFHVLFVVYDDEINRKPPIYLSSIKVEHDARLFHLNATLTLINAELRSLNHSLHNQKSIPAPVKGKVSLLGCYLMMADDDSSGLPNIEEIPHKPTKRRAILFTMDSISSYEAASNLGGAAGEIIIRRSLEEAFKHFHIDLDIIRSDADFDHASPQSYDIIILDPWTWAAKGESITPLS